MKPRGGGQHRAGVEPRLTAVEIGENATGLGNDDIERGDVEDIDIGFDDRVQLTGSEAMVFLTKAFGAYSC